MKRVTYLTRMLKCHFFLCILMNLFQYFLYEKQKFLKLIKMHRFLTFFFFANLKNTLCKAENELKKSQQKIKVGQNYGLINV